jgi:hypothetical protein
MSVYQTFVRCNSGHYFRGSVCPFDGWSMDDLDCLLFATIRLTESGLRPTIEELAHEGVPSSVLDRTLVIQFGSQDAVFEALDPAGYVIDGEWTVLRDVPKQFK